MAKESKKPELPLGKLNLKTVDISIRLEITRRGDGYYMMTSHSVPGLSMGSSTWETMFNDAPDAIRHLLRANCGIDW
jgi:hypothetical protein